MSQPKVTVVIPSFNHGKYLREAVDSVLTHGGPEVEIIIVDDGSTDGSSTAVAAQLQREGYQVLLQKNQGVAASRNNAIRLARGEFIIPLDADNRLLGPYFRDGVAILEANPTIGVVFGDARVIGEKSGTWVNHPMQLEEMLFENYIDTCTIIRKKMWEDVGGYDSNAPVPTRQDWIFWLDCISKNWEFRYLPLFCFEYRFLETSEVRKYFRQLKKRLLITEYIFQKQKALIDRFCREGKIEKEKGDEMMYRLQVQLAYYHLGFGNLIRGFSYWIRCLKSPYCDYLKLARMALIWPLRRLRGRE